MLQAGSHIDAAPNVSCIVALHDILAAVVEAAIAKQEAKSTIGEIVLVIFLDGV